MANQPESQVVVAIKRETTAGTAAGATGGKRLRITQSPGFTYDRASILSREKRQDGNVPMGRLGAVSVPGQYNVEYTVGGALDDVIEALVRSTWTASDSHSQSDFTSLAVASNVLTAASGSFVTEGYRVGQVIRLTGMSETANNDVNLLVVGVTASTLTVVGATLVDMSADTTFTITRLKHVFSGSGITRYAHTIEQCDLALGTDGLSELGLGMRVLGLSFSFRPTDMATVGITVAGMDVSQLDDGTSPYFTSPTVTTGLPLQAADAAIYYNGAVVAKFTSFDLNFQIAGAGLPVIGSLISPDVFDNDLQVSGRITGVRQDFSNLSLYRAETEFSIGIMLQEPESSPKDVAAIWLPRVKIGRLSAPAGGGDGAKIETLELMMGPIDAATGVEKTAVMFTSSGS